MQKVLIIVGPTASGKSALGVTLAKKFNGEIISADSRQVYKGLNIGSGKITKQEMKGVTHHLLDIASPKKAFSAADFSKKARAAIEDIANRRKLPIIVGGTGFYIDALVGRHMLPDVPPDAAFRRIHNKITTVELLCMLEKADPERAHALSTPSERNNKVRIIRALEIAKSLGKSPKKRSDSPYDTLWIGVQRPDAVLRKRINKRLKDRLKLGMVGEAQNLKKKGLSFKRMRELGLEYRSLARLLQKEIQKEQLEKELESDIWRYSRKQMGYWKRNKDIEWYVPQDNKIALKIREWLLQ